MTVQYENGKPVRVKTIVVSVQHSKDKDLDALRSEIIANVLWPVFEDFPFDKDTEILVNPSGRFVKGGPAADTGLTGRKIIVDTYGGEGAHGGGAFSGKDPTKVDRSAAYMAKAVSRTRTLSVSVAARTGPVRLEEKRQGYCLKHWRVCRFMYISTTTAAVKKSISHTRYISCSTMSRTLR